MAELSRCDRECVALKQKYLTESLQKRFASPWQRHTRCYFRLLSFQCSRCSFLLWQACCLPRKQGLCPHYFVEPPNTPGVSNHPSRKAWRLSCPKMKVHLVFTLIIFSPLILCHCEPSDHFPPLDKETDFIFSRTGHVYWLAIAA